MARVVGWLPPIAGGRVLAVRVGLDHRRVDREALAADEPFRDAAGDRRLEQLAEQIALAKATMPVLREGRRGSSGPAPPARGADAPAGVLDMLRIPGRSPQKVRLGIEN